MSGSDKKISFSFTKVKKPSLVNNANINSKEKIDYVDSFDGAKGIFSYKGNVSNEICNEQELVIPMISSKSLLDTITKKEDRVRRKENNANVLVRKNDNLINSANSLDEMAAAEILNDLKDGCEKGSDPNKIIIGNNISKYGVSDNTINYDEVPVGAFGLAMLRGMGWKPDGGIGKNPRLTKAVSPKLRPKGLGLGAKPKTQDENITKNNSLPTNGSPNLSS